MLLIPQVNRGGCSRSHGSGAAGVEDIALDLRAHLVEGLVRIEPEAVLDRAVVRGRAGVREEVESAVAPAAGATDDDSGEQRVVARGQERVGLRVRPLPLELLERTDDLQHLLDRVHAAASPAAGMDREVARAGVSLHTFDLDPEVHETSLGEGDGEIRRLDRDDGVGLRGSAAISRVPLPTTSSSVTRWKDESPSARSPRRGQPSSHTVQRRCRLSCRQLPVRTAGRRRSSPPKGSCVHAEVSPTGTTSRWPLNASERPPPEPANVATTTGVRVERGGRADVPCLDREAERAQQLLGEFHAAARLLGEVRRLLGLALGAEADECPQELVQLVLPRRDCLGGAHRHDSSAAERCSASSTASSAGSAS